MISIIREKAALITLTGAAALSLVIMTVSIAANREPTGQLAAADITTATSVRIYTLRDYNGQIAVFSSDSDEPLEIFDVSVNSFGEYDREALKHGITADSEEKINRLIEDYTS